MVRAALLLIFASCIFQRISADSASFGVKTETVKVDSNTGKILAQQIDGAVLSDDPDFKGLYEIKHEDVTYLIYDDAKTGR